MNFHASVLLKAYLFISLKLGQIMWRIKILKKINYYFQKKNFFELNFLKYTNLRVLTQTYCP